MSYCFKVPTICILCSRSLLTTENIETPKSIWFDFWYSMIVFNWVKANKVPVLPIPALQ